MTAIVVPRPAATVMLVRDAASPTSVDTAIEVLLLRRSANTPFVPGAHVFPGGAVDAGDAHPALDLVVDGFDDADASRILGVLAGGRAAWVAAVRECLEEAGILLATDRAGRPIPADHPIFATLEALRRDVETGTVALHDVFVAHDLRLPLASMAYVAQWITPEASPRRYDTRFFIAAMPAQQTVRVDNWEAVEASWWTAPAALAAWRAGDIQLIDPTVASLELLTNFASTADAVAALQAGANSPTRVPEPAGGERVPLRSEL